MMQRAQILIVEDDFITATDMKAQLETWGFGVCRVLDNGEKASELVAHILPDLILMNINIWGKINGIEAAKEINKQFNVPIIFISGYKQESLLEQAENIHPFWFLGKPVDEKKLLTTIELALANNNTF